MTPDHRPTDHRPLTTGTIGRRRAASLPEQPPQLWKSVKPRKAYDAIIVGGGGHGLATAYYLAKNHGLTNIAVLEKGWLAGGNTARNTTIIRSNYLWDESAAIYEHSLKLWETLEKDLGYEMFFSQRGVLTLAHSVSDVRSKRRNFFANALNGIDSEWLTPTEVKELVPIINISEDVRYPVHGATYQPRGGIAKHDWVAWGYAKAASDLGVEIIQGTEVTGFDIRENKVLGVHTSQGTIAAGKVGLVAAGHSSLLANLAGFSIPIQSRPLQALVSPLLEQVLNTVVMSGAVHVYVSQAHKGELVMGAGTDAFNSYAQRGGFHVIEHQLAAALELFPIFSRAQVLRTWGGVVDIAPDASPIIGLTPVENLFINTGWGTGGFKATPGSGWVMAYTMAHGVPHELNRPYALDRFVTGHLIDEHGAAGVAH